MEECRRNGYPAADSLLERPETCHPHASIQLVFALGVEFVVYEERNSTILCQAEAQNGILARKGSRRDDPSRAFARAGRA